MILLRTHVFGDRERAMIRRLESVPGHRIAVAADETRGPLDVGRSAKVSVTRAACRRLGLRCTRDFTWRNGDYALYLARRQFPDERFFWLIEPDVDHSFASEAALFERLAANEDADLLAPYLSAPVADWWWGQTARPHPTGTRRALFCFVGVSARALDLCLRERRRGRWRLRDRLLWPNDEAFVATEVIHAGLRAIDLNDLGAPLYDRETFGYDVPLDGDAGAFRAVRDRLFHSVLYGEAYRKRMKRVSAPPRRWPLHERARRKLQRAL